MIIWAECLKRSVRSFAECKWRNENVDLDALKTLLDRSGVFHYTKVHYFLFSKTGFTKGCIENAEEMGNVTLVSYEDIIMRYFSVTEIAKKVECVGAYPINGKRIYYKRDNKSEGKRTCV